MAGPSRSKASCAQYLQPELPRMTALFLGATSLPHLRQRHLHGTDVPGYGSSSSRSSLRIVAAALAWSTLRRAQYLQMELLS